MTAPEAPLTFTRTRIAPTPSGYLHLGNILSFALTAALAKKHKARILLRIDDLDAPRANPLYIRDIFDTLRFMEIPWEEGPRDPADLESAWSQKHRQEIYDDLLLRLAERDAIFACTCSRAMIIKDNPAGLYPGTCTARAIPLETAGTAWRLHMDPDPVLSLKTLSGAAENMAMPEAMRYCIVKRRDGLPAYQLASVADDLHFGVDLIVRGADLRSSTAAQLYLAGKAGLDNFQQSTFYHHPLLLDEHGAKLSKSAGSVSIRYLRDKGLNASAVYALIGRQLNLPCAVGDWETLAEQVMRNGGSVSK